MPETLSCRPVDPTPDLAGLVEHYRRHHGQSAAPDATLTWIAETARSGELSFFGAFLDSRLVGFATTHQVPASLRLGWFWQLRDLYVDPGARRRGVARQLLETVRDAAVVAGALRLSLQTEPDNAAALALYRKCGFTAVSDLTTLSLDLATP